MINSKIDEFKKTNFSIILSLFKIVLLIEKPYFYVFILCIFVIGVFLGVVGIACKKTSFFFLILLAIISQMKNITDKIEYVVAEKSTFFGISYTSLKWIMTGISDYPSIFILSVIFISAILTLLLVIITKILIFVGFAAIVYYLFNEGILEAFVHSIGVRNEILTYVIYAIIIFLLLIICKKLPDCLFACFFGFIGPFLSVLSFEMMFDLKWGYLKALQDHFNSDAELEMPEYFPILFILCVSCVVIQIFRKIKRKSKRAKITKSNIQKEGEIRTVI